MRLLTIIDEGNREGLEIAMGLSLPSGVACCGRARRKGEPWSSASSSAASASPRKASRYEVEGGYDFEARTRFDKLFAGVAAPQLADGRDVTGTEGIDRGDTWDADYARLLERAQKRVENTNVEWVASPPGFDPFILAGSVLRRVA